VNLTGILTFKLYGEPFVNTTVGNKRLNLGHTFANYIILINILFKHLVFEFIFKIVDLNNKILTCPFWQFAHVLCNS